MEKFNTESDTIFKSLLDKIRLIKAENPHLDRELQRIITQLEGLWQLTYLARDDHDLFLISMGVKKSWEEFEKLTSLFS